MNNKNNLNIFIILGLGLATWELYVAYKNQKDTVLQTELIKKGFNMKEDNNEKDT